MNNVSVKIDATKFNKWLKDAPQKVERAVQNVIQKVALLVEREGKINAPVDTNRLRSSIAASIRPLQAEVTANVNYAIYVHEGTRYMNARPFLADAAQTVQNDVESLVLSELKVLE